jgi:hypothetical protein
MTEKPKLDITNPGDAVPAFTCLVYIRTEDGRVSARVANLAGLQASGASERDVLAKIIPAFKQRVAEVFSVGEEIPWVDPPEPLDEGEQKRIVPVHL